MHLVTIMSAAKSAEVSVSVKEGRQIDEFAQSEIVSKSDQTMSGV